MSNAEQPNGAMNKVSKGESTEIRALLSESVLRGPSSVELDWKNFAIERRTSLPGEKAEFSSENHFLILWDSYAEGEIADRTGRFSPYRKYPNTITTCLPGIRPAVRSRFRHEMIVGALQPDYMREIEEELDKRPGRPSQGLYGTDDPGLRNLLFLLTKESETGGQYGTLYVESLVTALATRLLYAVRLEKPPAQTGASPLPQRYLRRVLERMQSGLNDNLDLATLATESGYSTGHFLRSFRAATGQTPSRYLLELRLEKARALIASRMPLVDIAAVCGFSSQGHLATAFRSKFGLAPSTYRRSL